MSTLKQGTTVSYKYIKANSILGNDEDEYALTKAEFYSIYSFFVSYSMCGNQSAKKRTFIDYGWETEKLTNTDLGMALSSVIKLNKNSNFLFVEKKELAEKFALLQLEDGSIENLDVERAVLIRNGENNNYLRLFYRIRDGFAHGKFKLRYSSQGKRMVIIQDDDGNCVTARIVISLDTILRFVTVIDVHRIINND